MKLLMYILKKNNKLNIDNRTESMASIISKFDEERKEVVVALLNYNSKKSLENLREIVRETFDMVQMCILILWRSSIEGKKYGKYDLIQEINFEHKDKLINRQWVIETGIEIDVKE